MRHGGRDLVWLGIVIAVAVAGAHPGVAQNKALATSSHPIVGAWIGSGAQVCPSGVAPSACWNGTAAGALMVMPTFTSDGHFFADDTLTLAGPPFGPHSAEHGNWTATSGTDFTAVDVFIANPFPPSQGHTALFLARWTGTVNNDGTVTGWFDGYPQPPVPVSWTQLVGNEFPAFPAEAGGVVDGGPASSFVKDPTLCVTPNCPIVFKFTLKRLVH